MHISICGWIILIYQLWGDRKITRLLSFYLKPPPAREVGWVYGKRIGAEFGEEGLENNEPHIYVRMDYIPDGYTIVPDSAQHWNGHTRRWVDLQIVTDYSLKNGVYHWFNRKSGDWLFQPVKSWLLLRFFGLNPDAIRARLIKLPD